MIIGSRDIALNEYESVSTSTAYIWSRFHSQKEGLSGMRTFMTY